MFPLEPATGDSFVGREKLLEEMLIDLRDTTSWIGYAIYGTRRIGKTSVFKELERELKGEEKIVVIYLSLWNFVEPSLEEFCNGLAKSVINAYRPYLGLKFKASEILKTPLSVLRKISELSFVYEDLELLISFKGENIDELVERVFSLPEKLAKKTDTKCVLLLDEFPSIIDLKIHGKRVGEGIVRKIRTLYEEWRKTTLCISGSIRSTMDLVVLSSASPFYRQLIVRRIPPLEEKDVLDFLQKNLNIEKKAAREVYRFSGGIPFYIQFMGRMLSRKREPVRLDNVLECEKEFLKHEGNILFTEEFDNLSGKERLVLKSLASGKCTSSSIAKDLKEKVSNVGQFINYLENKDIVQKKKRGRYYIVDPVYEEWLVRR